MGKSKCIPDRALRRWERFVEDSGPPRMLNTLLVQLVSAPHPSFYPTLHVFSMKTSALASSRIQRSAVHLGGRVDHTPRVHQDATLRLPEYYGQLIWTHSDGAGFILLDVVLTGSMKDTIDVTVDEPLVYFFCVCMLSTSHVVTW